MPIPDGDKASERSLLQKMIPTAGIFGVQRRVTIMNEEKKKRGTTTEQKTLTFRDVYEALSAIDVKSRLETVM